MRTLLALLVLASPAQEAKAKIVLIGKDRDHPPATHEYLAECRLLAACLKQTAGIEAVVSDGWPKDPEVLKGSACIVLYTAMGGDALFKGPNKDAALELLKKGTGLAAVHWSTGASEGEPEELQLKHLGGCFGFKFSKFLVRETTLKRADPAHPIARGWEDFKLKDEYYIQLKHHADAKPAMTAEIDGKAHTVAWTYERPDGGRSFGTVNGHFHDCFGIEAFRRGLVNGILWAAKLEVPKGGALCAVTPQDLELPPDPRKK